MIICQRTVNDIMQGLWVVLCPMLFAFTGSDIDLVSSGIDLVTWCWMIFIVLLTVIVSITIFYSVQVECTVDSQLLGRSSTRLQLNWVLLEPKSVIRFTTSTHYVPILVWVAHSPVCSLYSWDRVANYYCNVCSKSGSHFHSVSFFLRLIQKTFCFSRDFKISEIV